MEEKLDYQVQFSAKAEPTQLEAVEQAAHTAHEARVDYDHANAWVADSERKKIDLSDVYTAYAILPPLTAFADSALSYCLFQGIFPDWPRLMIAIALLSGMVAVTVESFASHLWHTKDGRVIRFMSLIAGVAIPLGICWVVELLQRALVVNAPESADGAGAKLWTFAATAIILHIFLLLAGDRVRRGTSQLWREVNLWTHRWQRDFAYSNWRRSCRAVVLLDHRLITMVEIHNVRNPRNLVEMPQYDTFTMEFLAQLKRQGGVPDPAFSKPIGTRSETSSADERSGPKSTNLQ